MEDDTPGWDAGDGVPRMASDNGDKRVAVPSAFYKILVHREPGGHLETLSVLVPNTETKLPSGDAAERQYYVAHLVSIADIEKVTGLDFFPELEASDPSAAQQFKDFKATALWEAASWPRRLDALCH